jgi:hypothetical protein
VVTFIRTFWPERRPHRRRRRADADAARRSYTELADDGTPLRHIESRADDGTWLAAVTGTAPALPPGGEEMHAEVFEELWRRARCHLDGLAQIRIHEVRPQTPDGVPVVARCIGGRVRVGSRLDRSSDPDERVDFTVTRIEGAAELRPLRGALLTLSGSGRLRADLILDGHT